MTDPHHAQRADVFVNWIEPGKGLWTATWQRGDEFRDTNGTRAEVTNWALQQEADQRWIFDADENAYVPLGPE